MVVRVRIVPLLALALVALACVPQQRQIRSSALDFLYPTGHEAGAEEDVTLRLPVRVGVAFAPARVAGLDSFTETQRQQLLDRVAAAFRGRDGIASVEAIPSSFLEPGGGFDNLDRVAAALGVDVVALISYDQFQFSESGRSSWAYWTLIGAYIVEGEKNETRTVLDAVVYDIASRAMLFHASGSDASTDRSTPVDAAKVLRRRSEESFSLATDDLIERLDDALAAFEEQAATGTVRGAGTPAIAMLDEQGRPIGSGGEGGAGSLGAFAAALLAALAALGLATRRNAPR